MPAMQISFAVEEKVFKRLQERATKMNLRAAQYAQRLFEAAYFVRVVQERGEKQPDAELDRQVRTAFLLADCEAEFIAEAIGAPKTTVEKILAGWREYFSGSASRAVSPASPAGAPAGRTTGSDGLAPYGNGTAGEPAATEGAAVAADRPPHARLKGNQIETIRRMWAEGAKVAAIAAAVGKSEKGMQNWAAQNRDICPARLQAARPSAGPAGGQPPAGGEQAARQS